jgi:hypothetical protein
MMNGLSTVSSMDVAHEIFIPPRMRRERNSAGMNFKMRFPNINIQFQHPISTHMSLNPNALVLSTIRLNPEIATNVINMSVQFFTANGSFLRDGINRSNVMYTQQQQLNGTILIPAESNFTIWGLSVTLLATSDNMPPVNVTLKVLMHDCINNYGNYELIFSRTDTLERHLSYMLEASCLDFSYSL